MPLPPSPQVPVPAQIHITWEGEAQGEGGSHGGPGQAGAILCRRIQYCTLSGHSCSPSPNPYFSQQ